MIVDNNRTWFINNSMAEYNSNVIKHLIRLLHFKTIEFLNIDSRCVVIEIILLVNKREEEQDEE